MQSSGIPSQGQAESGSLVGKITFPSIGQQFPITKGISDEDLKGGVGYDPATPIPGSQGNSILAGHRDTVFRKLGELRHGDEIRIETANETLTFEMVDHIIVDKDEKHAIAASQDRLLTLITCYPFSYIGDAPEVYSNGKID